MSHEGERCIREYVAHEPPPGMETSLTSAFRKIVRDRDGCLIERFDGQHYLNSYIGGILHVLDLSVVIMGASVHSAVSKQL